MQELHETKRQCPLPALMRHLRMGKKIQRITSSPFRVDQNPSWGIYRDKRGDYRWKDLGTGDSGDQISFLAHYLHLDERENFRDLVAIFSAIADELNVESDADVPFEIPPEVKGPRILPDKTGLKPGTDEQIKKLSELRGISIDALRWAQERGLLIFGHEFNHEVYGVTDQGSQLVEIRRLDGQPFPELGTLKERKSHAILHSDKAWPLGIIEAKSFPCVAIVEGLPDFLAAHDFILREQVPDGDKTKIKCAPVGLMTAMAKISDDALPNFAGKIVRIFSHADEPGLKAAARWMDQLNSAGARQVTIFDLTVLSGRAEQEINDLNDLLRVIDTEPLKNIPVLRKIIPTA